MEKSKDEFLQSISLSFQTKPQQLYNYLSSLNKLKSKSDFLIQEGQNNIETLCFNNYFHSTFTDGSFLFLLRHDYQHLPQSLTILISLRKKYTKGSLSWIQQKLRDVTNYTQ